MGRGRGHGPRPRPGSPPPPAALAAPAAGNPPMRALAAAIMRGPAAPPQGRLRRRLRRSSAERSAPLDPEPAGPRTGSYQGSALACPGNPPTYRITNPDIITSDAQELQSLDQALPMRAQVGRPCHRFAT